ncbi:GMC oxidoreductase [Trametes maxima]|nr:GMC oxidoreductase [Trametes maxima]
MWPFSSDQAFPEVALEEVGTADSSASPAILEEYTYDYIIVGGGTAGSCLASRLSEDPDVTVLVLERGGIADGWADRVPLISSNPYRAGAPIGRWWAQPMPEVNDRSFEVVCGETMGGTSAINCMFYTRGPAGDYNRWAELGNEGWGYCDLEPYFIKSEHASRHAASDHRGKEEYRNNLYKHTDYVIRASQKAGIQPMDDLSTPSAPAAGFVRHDVSQDTAKRRHTPFHAFLPAKLVQERKARLKICRNVLVSHVEFAKDEPDIVQATGVHFEAADYRQAGRSFYARARREVVLCAGALGSPQILQLSGIGPREHLQAKSIPVVRDMPGVGSYLQDHIAVPLTFEAPMSDSLHELEASPLKVFKELITYLLTGNGLFSYPFQAVTLYLPSALLDDSSTIPASALALPALDTTVFANCPDLEVMPAPNNCTDHDIPGKGLFSFIIGNIRPKSHGTVRLASRNPRARPDVDLGFLTDPRDLEPLRKGLRLGMRLADDMRQQGYPLGNLIVPESLDDTTLDAFVRQNLRTCYHYTSTCRMGPEDEPGRPGVVDARLRVHGVRGLRVCDASIFPQIVGAHTMAPSVVVAEKCADLIKQDWRKT